MVADGASAHNKLGSECAALWLSRAEELLSTSRSMVIERIRDGFIELN